MNCRDIQNLLALDALGDLEEAARRVLQDHLHRCRECRRAQADYRGLLGDLRRQAGPRVSDLHLIRRTLAAARDDLRAAHRRRWRRRLLGCAGSLAAAVILVGAGLKPAPTPRVAGRPGTALRPRATLWTRPHVGSALSMFGDDIAVGAGRVFVLAEDAGRPQMVALDSRSGQTLWRCREPALGYLSADTRRVYGLARASDGAVHVVAVDPRTGQVLWRFPAGSPQDAQACTRPRPLAGGRLCWSRGNTVYAIEAAGGQEVWRQTLAGEQVLSEAVQSGRDWYVAGRKGVYCLDGRTGALKAKSTCEAETDGWVRPLLAVSGRRLFLATAQREGKSRVFCLDTQTHRCLWDQVTPRVSHLQAEGESVYVRCQHVYALDPGSGEFRWQYPASGCGPVTTCHGLVWFVDGTDGGALVALDRTSGVRKWHVPGLRSCQGILVAGTTAYLKTTDCMVHAFRLGS